MIRVALLSPLPPARTGIAHYASMLLPALRQRAEVDVTAFDSLGGYARDRFDVTIHQLGNNPHHEWIFAEALRVPGVIVLHDLVLHHLIVEMTLARGDADAYIAALERNHGEAGAAWARGRTVGLHSEMGNFLLPSSIEVANRSLAVIVHNHYAADRLRSFGVTTPIHVVPHPYVPEPAVDGAAVRARLGFTPDDRVIGLFGFLTSAKRAEIVLDAFRLARARDPKLRLLIVGEPAPNIDISAMLDDGVVATGYVDDDQFGAFYAATDRLVNLRYPSAGETSGTLIRAFDAGKPVAVSDYAQFAEYPDSCVVKIAFGPDEAAQLADFFTRELDVDAIANAQRAWLAANATLDLTVDAYLRVLQDSHARTASRAITAALPLFPRLEVVATQFEGDVVTLTLRNGGEQVLRARSYGEPGYRLIVKVFDGARVVQDRWLLFNGDVAPGKTTSISFRLDARAPRLTLRLYDALEGIPMLEPAEWASVDVELAHVQ